VRSEIAYIVFRESILHARARAFSLRWGQIVTCSLPYSGVSASDCCQGAWVGRLIRLDLTF